GQQDHVGVARGGRDPTRCGTTGQSAGVLRPRAAAVGGSEEARVPARVDREVRARAAYLHVVEVITDAAGQDVRPRRTRVAAASEPAVRGDEDRKTARDAGPDRDLVRATRDVGRAARGVRSGPAEAAVGADVDLR